jgi:spore coat protein CotH
MAQNYYLYERGGQITILPWDYNLAWGGFQSGDASAVINFPIDTPVSGVAMTDRPLLSQLLSNQDYLAQYHDHLNTLIQNYFADGHFTTKVQALNTLISDYVKKDATAFCTYEEYKTAVEAFIELGNLRAESIQGQLSGDIPSTTEGQKVDPSSLISADDLNLQDLGSMMGKRGK